MLTLRQVSSVSSLALSNLRRVAMITAIHTQHQIHPAAARSAAIGSLLGSTNTAAATRSFTNTPCLLKKGGNSKKSNKKSNDEDDDDSSSSNSSTTAAPPPFDFEKNFTTITKSLEKLLTKIKDDLSRLRSSASNDLSLPISKLESLQIPLDSASTKSSTTTHLRDLAHITPKPNSPRRHIQITIHSPTDLPTKTLISLIQKSPLLEMHPTLEDPTNSPNVLTISLPPPTREGREKLAEQAGKLGEKVKGEIRLIRQDGLKGLKGLLAGGGKGKSSGSGGGGAKGVKVDDVRKEEAKVEKEIKRVEEEVKKVVDVAKKGILEN